MKILMLLVVMALVATGCSTVGQNGNFFNASKIRELKRGVFEVVIPKIEDEFIKYDRPLPKHLLPFQERNDKYVSIGTAFLIGKKKIISAAHVFGLHEPAKRYEFFLRNFQGKVFRIKSFSKYSQYRDIAELVLESWPEEASALEIDYNHQEGNRVFTVGNALGEGIVIRQGNITSYTYEEVFGKWKFIRFTAAASPGNSGGPLINNEGKVIGIVVRKSSSENLNYAVPLRELETLPVNSAEFLLKGIPVKIDKESGAFKWKFETKMPDSMEKLASIAQGSLQGTFDKALAQFFKQKRDKVFPHHPGIKRLLREWRHYFYPGAITRENESSWKVEKGSYESFVIKGDQRIYIDFSESRDNIYTFVLERPKGVALKTFLDNPVSINKTFLRAISYHRMFAGQKIKILSYGKPESKFYHRDQTGRPWFNYQWRIEFSQNTINMKCTPLPMGIACVWMNVPTSYELPVMKYLALSLRKVVFSYKGKIRNWIEYTKLPDKYKNISLKDVKVSLRNNVFKFRTTGVKVNFKNQSLNLNSIFYFKVRPDIANIFNHKISGFALRPHKYGEKQFSLENIIAPNPENSEKKKRFWRKLSLGQYPYTKKVISDDDSFLVYTPRKAKKRKINGHYITSRNLITCITDRGQNKKIFKRSCNQFNRSITWRVK